MKTHFWHWTCLWTAVTLAFAPDALARNAKEVGRAAGLAQIEARKHAAVLDCRIVSMVSSKQKDWTTDYGSYSADTLSFKRYQAKVINHEATRNEYELHWSFVGRVDAAREDTVVERGKEKLTLSPKESAEVMVESTPQLGRKEVYAALGEKYTEGIKIRGLVLQLLQDGQVIRTWYSSQQWKNQSWLLPFEVD